MNRGNSHIKIIDFINHLFFLLLVILAITYFQERLYADSGYYLFKVVNSGCIWIEHNRFILIFSQLLPLMAVKLHFGLKTVLLLYSIGHVLFFYSIYLLCRYVFKNHWAGLVLVLIQVVGLISGFFVPVFELYYASGLMVLFSTILFSGRKNLIVLQLILAFFILTSHPTTYFLFFYVLIIYALNTRKLLSFQYLYYLILFIGVVIFKSIIASEYEIGKTQAFYNTLRNATFDMHYLKSLLFFLFQYYKDLLLLFVIVISLQFYTGKFSHGILFITTFIGLLAISNVARYGFEHTRYQEQVYFPLVFLVAFTFVDELRSIKIRRLCMSLSYIAVLVFLWKMNVIRIEGLRFNQRTQVMKELIAKAQEIGGDKFVVSKSYLNTRSSVEANWSYSIESILLSSIGRDKNTITICTDEDYLFNENCNNILPDQYLFRRWEIYSDETLNSQYFCLSEGMYQRIE